MSIYDERWADSGELKLVSYFVNGYPASLLKIAFQLFGPLLQRPDLAVLLAGQSHHSCLLNYSPGP